MSTGQSKSKALTAKETVELRRLQRKWATRRASAREIERCRSLERRAANATGDEAPHFVTVIRSHYS